MSIIDEELRSLRAYRDEVRDKLNSINEVILRLERERARAEFPCSCVRLNHEIEIYDMVEQQRRGRRPVGASAGKFVADCLSARHDCLVCRGSGIPT